MGHASLSEKQVSNYNGFKYRMRDSNEEEKIVMLNNWIVEYTV